MEHRLDFVLAIVRQILAEAAKAHPICEISSRAALRSWRGSVAAAVRRIVAVGVLGATVLCATAAHSGQPMPVNRATSEALALCDEADRVSVAERSAVLERGVARAEEAVQTDPADAVAHFAVFCTLGKRLQMNWGGAGVFAALREIGRVRQEIDIALSLAPDYPAALAAKGEMLIELPSLLGGDAEEGERLLRRAAAIDPGDRRIRVMLAEAVKIVGEGDEAIVSR